MGRDIADRHVADRSVAFGISVRRFVDRKTNRRALGSGEIDRADRDIAGRCVMAVSNDFVINIHVSVINMAASIDVDMPDVDVADRSVTFARRMRLIVIRDTAAVPDLPITASIRSCRKSPQSQLRYDFPRQQCS